MSNGSARGGDPTPRSRPHASPPTSSWLATTAAVMPPLTGPAGTAERLLLLLHYGIDWRTGWVTKNRATYWSSVLPARVVAATYRSTTLRRWWSDVAAQLESEPRTDAERLEVALLVDEDPLPVLHVLRTETEALVLRTRIVADHVRAAKPTREEEEPS